MLSIYFEETSAYQYKQTKNHSNHSSNHFEETITDLEIGDDEDA